MKIIAFVLNLPWTVISLLGVLVSIPEKVIINKKPFAFVFRVKSFWWYTWLPGMKHVRAMALGNVVMLSPNILSNDLEHELVHTKQFEREPLIQPVLYWIESFRKGYRHNKYEEEAYNTTDSIHVSNEWSFGNDEMARKLKELVLNGTKTATTGFLKPTTKVPKVGDHEAILDKDGKRFCIIQYTKVEVKLFLEVDFEFAKLEGEGDQDIEEWRQKHRDYFNKHYDNFTDESMVVCLEFKVAK